MNGHFRRVVVLLAALSALALSAPVAPQSYPVKPVRVIVPFAPGGGTDIQARVLFKELTEQFRQSFIVDNRPGASGLIGAETVVNAAADALGCVGFARRPPRGQRLRPY